MLTYSQSTGQLRRDGTLLAICYAGNGEGLNNPAMQHVKSVGPPPVGKYRLFKIDGELAKKKKLGPVIFRMDPEDWDLMLNRSGFYIHWDNAKKNYTASNGCIIPLTTGVWAEGVLKHLEILEVIT